jgi:hypothetical protein
LLPKACGFGTLNEVAFGNFLKGKVVDAYDRYLVRKSGKAENQADNLVEVIAFSVLDVLQEHQALKDPITRESVNKTVEDVVRGLKERNIL